MQRRYETADGSACELCLEKEWAGKVSGKLGHAKVHGNAQTAPVHS